MRGKIYVKKSKIRNSLSIIRTIYRGMSYRYIACQMKLTRSNKSITGMPTQAALFHIDFVVRIVIVL